MNIFSIAFALFLLMDSIGNIPLYLSFLKGIAPKRQRTLIVRELVIALAIIILFSFLGEGLMQFLDIQPHTIQIAGGIILFLLCLKMIFPVHHDPDADLPHRSEPFIVPLAVPLVAGPAVLAAVIIYAKQEQSRWVMTGAILLAWLASLIILLASSYLKTLLGWRGILALERLMGLILILIAVQMFLSGLGAFMAYTEMTSKFGFGQRESSRNSSIEIYPMLETWGRLRSANYDALAQPKIQILKPFRYTKMCKF
jgi:multiple antibiotic resistance protein